MPAELAGEEISRPLRIVRVAHDLVAIARARDGDAAIAALARRRGRGYDPRGRRRRAGRARDARCARPTRPTRGSGSIDAEPEPVATISAPGWPAVARAFGEFADLKVASCTGTRAASPSSRRRPPRRSAARAPRSRSVRAAGFLHDLGRVAVPNGIWDKPGPLSAAEWERVRLHPYYTERVLERSGALAPLARLAGAHHERLDGSGYHRGAARRAADRRARAAGRRRRL